MKKSKTKKSQRATLTLLKGGGGESGSAFSPFGPMRANLITSPSTSKEVPLTELLNCLERKITDLNIKSYEVLNTFLSDTTHLAEPTSFGLTQAPTITKICEECGDDLVVEGESECLECLTKSMLSSNS